MGSSTHLTAADLRWLSPLPLWTGILVGPIAFAINLTVTYALVHRTCEADQQSVLHVVSLVALLMVVAAGWVSWLGLQHTPAGIETDQGTPIARARFMALLGLASSAFFMFAIIANAYPQWVLDACR